MEIRKKVNGRTSRTCPTLTFLPPFSAGELVSSIKDLRRRTRTCTQLGPVTLIMHLA